jgi:hypothetical protein
MQIHFIPAGLIDQYQPLDRRIFGALKSSAREMLLRRSTTERGARLEKLEGVQTFIHCSENLSDHVITSACKIYSGKLGIWCSSEDKEE